MRLFSIVSVAFVGLTSLSGVLGQVKVGRGMHTSCNNHITFKGLHLGETHTCITAASLDPKLLKNFCKSKITNIGSGKWLKRKKKGRFFCPLICKQECKETIIDKSIITCSVDSQPTVCSSPVSSISCDVLHKKVNTCAAIVAHDSSKSCIYDPNNCGNNVKGCNADGIQDCRFCDFGSYEACQYGAYAKEYACPCDFNTADKTFDEVLGIPVQVDCTKFYASLDKIQEQGCLLNTAAFKPFIENPGTIPNSNCPPRLHQLFMSYGVSKGYQKTMTKNSNGTIWPKPSPNKTCERLALGQEYGFGDAGELTTIEITAKTMAMRMLKPATYNFSDLIANCCDIQCTVSHNKNCTNCERCYDYGESSIENPVTWINHTNLERTPYQYQVPSATQPQLASTNGQRTERVMKGMHGKGQSCLSAKFSFAPLKKLYDSNKTEGDESFIPLEQRVGLLNPKLAYDDASFETLVRFAGNKNFTIKDVHDIRVRGFGLKLFGVDSEFKRLNIPYNQLKLADIPSYDQPDNAQYVFGNFNFRAAQELGHLDLLHVAIGSGEGFDGVPYFSTDSVEQATNPPANIFVAHNVENYYNGFVLGGAPAPNLGELTKTYQNPLQYIYGSASALRLGSGGAMKLHWAACPGESYKYKLKKVYGSLAEAWKDPNYFLTNLRETIENNQEFKMCGYIQLQESPCSEPIQDPTSRWLTRSINVFELIFPMQTVPDYNTFCDNTVLQPYRTILEHQPLGYINRVRQAVYQYSNQFRLVLNNGVTETEYGDSIGQATCPMGYSSIPKGQRPVYQGPPILTASQDFVLDDGNIPPPQPDSSSGICRTDGECQLPFGIDSSCQTDGTCLK